MLGRYFPSFHICSVLLAAEPPTSSETKFIRLLTENRLPEAKALLQELGGMQLSVGITEELILPTLRAIENDLYPGASSPKKSRIFAHLARTDRGNDCRAPNGIEAAIETIDIWTVRNGDRAFHGRRRRNCGESYRAFVGG